MKPWVYGEMKSKCWFLHDWQIIEEIGEGELYDQVLWRHVYGGVLPCDYVPPTSETSLRRLKSRVCLQCGKVDNQIAKMAAQMKEDIEENERRDQEGKAISRKRRKPWAYIASPYTIGDQAINCRFQIMIFDRLMNDGKCWPIAPLLSHFQHLVMPRPYQDWMDYDLALLDLLKDRESAVLRLNAEFSDIDYLVEESKGADKEVVFFEAAGKPVFTSIEGLYEWIDSLDVVSAPSNRDADSRGSD